MLTEDNNTKTNKKTVMRSMIERIARIECIPPLRIEEMLYMTTKDVLDYIATHKEDIIKPGKKKTVIQENLYTIPEPIDHKKFTSTVKDEIDKASCIKDLVDIFAKYVNLHKHPDFLTAMKNKKNEINEKLEKLRNNN